MGCYSPWKDDVLVRARAWANLENSLPCGRSLTPKAMWYMIPLIWSVQKTQIPRNIKEISGCQELGWDRNREWLLMGTRFPFDMMKMSWDYMAWWLLWEEVRESVWLPVDLWAGPGQLESPHHLPRPWSIHPAHCSHAESVFKDTVLREPCVAEISWVVYMTEPSLGPRDKHWDSMGGHRDLLAQW